MEILPLLLTEVKKIKETYRYKFMVSRFLLAAQQMLCRIVIGLTYSFKVYRMFIWAEMRVFRKTFIC